MPKTTIGDLIPVGRRSSSGGTPYNDGGADGSTSRQNSVYCYEGIDTTPTFSVSAEHDEVLVLHAFNFPPGTKAQIDHVLGANSGTMFTPTIIAGIPMELSDTNTQVVIPYSGRFRVRFTGGWPAGAKVMELRQQRVLSRPHPDYTGILARLDDIEAEMPDDFLISAPVVGDTIQLTLNNGTIIPVDLTPYLDNNNIVPGTYTLDGTGTTDFPLLNGAVVTIDHTALATDQQIADLEAWLQLVDDEERFLDNITVDAQGNATFIDNFGNVIGTHTDNNIVPGTYTLADGNTALPLEDGTIVNLDGSLFATDADLANAVISLTNMINAVEAAEDFLNQPTLAGNTFRFPMELGTTYTVDMSRFDESLTNNGNGTYTFNNGSGGTVTFRGDDDITAVNTSYNAGTRTITTQVVEGTTSRQDTVQLPVATNTGYGLIRLNDLPNPDDDITAVNTSLNAGNGVLTTQVVEGGTSRSDTVDLDPRIIRLQPNSQYFRADLAANAYTITSGTAVGPRAGSTFSLTFNVPADAAGVEPMIEFHGGWRMTSAPNNTNQVGEANLRPQYRIDGGAWQQMNVSGDRNVMVNAALGPLEQELFRSAKGAALSAGSHTVQFRTNINDNTIPAGGVLTSFRQTGVVHFIYNRFV